MFNHPDSNGNAPVVIVPTIGPSPRTSFNRYNDLHPDPFLYNQIDYRGSSSHSGKEFFLPGQLLRPDQPELDPEPVVKHREPDVSTTGRSPRLNGHNRRRLQNNAVRSIH